MADTGWVLAGTGASDSRNGPYTGTITAPAAWSNPDRITANDGSFASSDNNNVGSGFLVATNFGFSIPSNAVITGVEARLSRRTENNTGFGNTNDGHVILWSEGDPLGSNLAIATNWTTTAGVVTYGSTTELWGVPLTPDDVNSSAFGVAFSAKASSTTKKLAEVDYVEMRVTYDTSGAGDSYADAFPGTVANDSGVGNIAWTNPGNVDSIANDTRATASVDGTTDTSQYLKCTNFGFSIPSTANILGIVAFMERRVSSISSNIDIIDNRVRLVKGGTIQSTDKATTNKWYEFSSSAGDERAIYGGKTDLWSNSWTPSDINSSGFGVAISCKGQQASGTNLTAGIDRVWIRVFYEDTNVDVPIDNASHGHSAQNVTLTQVHSVSIANLSHGHTMGSPALTQNHVLAIDSMAHGHSAQNSTITPIVALAIDNAAHANAVSSPTLGQVHSLFIENASHANTVGNVTLTQAHIVPISDMQHGHAAGNLSLSQVHQLGIDNAAHGHSAGNGTLSQIHSVSIANAGHAHTADSLTLSQVHQLGIDSATHGHSAEQASLSLIVALDPDNLGHAHTVSTPTLGQNHLLDADSLSHGHSLENGTVENILALIITNCLHGHAAGAVSLSQHHLLVIDDAAQGHSVGSVNLNQVHDVSIQSAIHSHTIAAGSLSQNHLLAIDDALHTQEAAEGTLNQVHQLAVSNASHAHVAESAVLRLNHVLDIQSAAHGHFAESIGLGQVHSLHVDSVFHPHAAENASVNTILYLDIHSAQHAHALDSVLLSLAAANQRQRRISLTAAGREQAIQGVSRLVSVPPLARTVPVEKAGRTLTPENDRHITI